MGKPIKKFSYGNYCYISEINCSVSQLGFLILFKKIRVDWWILIVSQNFQNHNHSIFTFTSYLYYNLPSRLLHSFLHNPTISASNLHHHCHSVSTSAQVLIPSPFSFSILFYPHVLLLLLFLYSISANWLNFKYKNVLTRIKYTNVNCESLNHFKL